ncbi:MAG TPA: winged helix-turn-helix domain-containing protein [Jatrophihabitantaceae bacterium]
MTARPAPSPGHHLVVGPDPPQLSVVRSPHLSLEPLLLSAATGPAGFDRAPGRELVHAVRRALPYRAGFALAPLAASVGKNGRGDLVDAFGPIPPYADVSIQEQIERMRDAPDEVLLDDLRHIYGDALPRWWHPAAERPRAWFTSLAGAVGAAFAAIGHRWRAAGPAIDREIQRVGTALVRGGHDALLNTLDPRLHYRDGVLTMGWDTDHSVPLGGRRLVLVPRIGRPQSLMASFDRPDLVYVAYTLPRRATASPTPTGDPLAMLLGPIRAQALRRLAGPMTAGALAQVLNRPATNVAYHCKQLELADLIRRERRGQSVWITRTARGQELIELMS